MKKFKLFLGMALLVIFTLAACSSSQPVDNVIADPAEDASANMENEQAKDNMEAEGDNAMSEDTMGEENGEMSEPMHDEEPKEEAMDEDMAEDGSGDMEMMETSSSAWYTHQFTDAATGETFSISDFKGERVVLVETLALWCSNCLRQQQQVRELHSLLGEREDFVSVGINIDPSEDLGMVADYVNNNGFDWLYGVAPDEIIGDISATLGGQFLNPPSTPIVLIDKEGNQFPLPFGIKSADTLLSYIQEHLN
ncbi:MAG: TlpA disulfide reductase family protein [Anaerolineales bacterium]